MVYCADIVGYYRGEDSGARYPEYEEQEMLSIPLEPFLHKKGNENISIQQLLTSLENTDSRSWGDWYIPHRLYEYCKF